MIRNLLYLDLIDTIDDQIFFVAILYIYFIIVLMDLLIDLLCSPNIKKYPIWLLEYFI